MKILIKVTQKHINGCNMATYTHETCPIALAIKDVIRDRIMVCSNSSCKYIHIGELGGIAFKCTKPRSVKRFIRNFDTKGKKAVKPFSFYLDI